MAKAIVSAVALVSAPALPSKVETENMVVVDASAAPAAPAAPAKVAYYKVTLPTDTKDRPENLIVPALAGRFHGVERWFDKSKIRGWSKLASGEYEVRLTESQVLSRKMKDFAIAVNEA